MFKLVSDESSQKLGIEVHKLRFYAFEMPLLAGTAIHDSTARNFSIAVGPNLNAMREIADGDPDQLRLAFDKARTQSVAIGRFKSLDVADTALRGLNNAYEMVLKHFGAAGRILKDEGNARSLVEDPAASKARYGDAIVSARTVQAFRMMEQNEHLDFRTMVGKVMPVFLTALGLKEYQVGQDLDKDGSGKVQFVIDRVGMFEFYPAGEGEPPLVQRYSFFNGKYQRTAGAVATGYFMRHHVFEWLAAAARDLNAIDEDVLRENMDQVARTLRDNLVFKKSTPLLREGDNILVLRPR